ncbi:LysR substrate binding domain protein [Vibrio aerogenes CECT 7868]|uniref:LysR substrate binding domain protein n=1 Tax=Vibrio aerogenes CECT 7868 TaxID=1216006 RepID=A0A1M5ZYU2_9VIBR|nr:LysR substrate-binding domain-containing protein [Vibrio aerogenes]SHI29424.1 LysR substrate binding domain protein [Vibrio aerogenes CECT 7868]
MKNGRHLILSYDGQRLAPYAKNLIEMHDKTLAQLKSEAPTTQIRLGCPDDYAESVLPELVRLFHQQWPQLDLQITAAPSHRIRMMLDSNHLDAGIVTRSPTSEEGYPLQQEQGVWVRAFKDRQLLAMEPLPVVLFQPECKFHQAAIDGLIKQNKNFKVMACTSSASTLRGLINHGLGIGAMARSSMGNGLEEISGNILPKLPMIEVVLILSGRKENPLTEALAQQLSHWYQAGTHISVA